MINTTTDLFSHLRNLRHLRSDQNCLFSNRAPIFQGGGAGLRYEDVLRQAEQDRVLPVYLVYGGEPLLEQELVQGLKGLLVDPAREALDYHVFPGDQLGQALLMAQTVPFLYDDEQNRPRRLVVVRDSQLFAPTARAREEKEDEETTAGDDEGLLRGYLENPPRFTCLVITVAGGRMDGRRKLTRLITGMDAAVECRIMQPRRQNREGRLDMERLVAWVDERAQQCGKRLVADAARMLVERVGGDLQTLHMELEKLALYTGDRDTISPADVRALVAGTTEDELFPLLDAVGFGRPGEAVAQFRQLLRGHSRGDEVARRTLGALASHLRRVLAAKALASAGVSYQQAAQQQGGHAFYWEKLYKQSRLRSRDQLAAALERLLQANIDLNSGLEPEQTMELVVLDLATAQQAGR